MRPLIQAVITADELEIDQDDDGSFVVVIPFADSEDETYFASLECKASEGQFEGHDFYEFCFFISLTPIDGEDDEIIDIWTSEAARSYVPDEVRKLLLPIVCEAYKKLLEDLGRPSIYRVTYGADPSPEALAKHELITNALQDYGYEIEECGTDETGRAFWMMAPKV